MSGKSTIVRQLDMMHQGSYTIEQRMTYRTTVRRNLLESAHCILVAMRGLGLDCVAPENRPRAQRVLTLSYQGDTSLEDFDKDIAREVFRLWQDPVISTVMDRSHGCRFGIPDNAN